jgi:hypothetical protein
VVDAASGTGTGTGVGLLEPMVGRGYAKPAPPGFGLPKRT